MLSMMTWPVLITVTPEVLHTCNHSRCSKQDKSQEAQDLLIDPRQQNKRRTLHTDHEEKQELYQKQKALFLQKYIYKTSASPKAHPKEKKEEKYQAALQAI